eukprot:GILK01004618.1.p1 GENE.GILK01004618.1~~GILK01004618.1.p1  ORF type:complete len:1398 (-),score=319.35 GILK01004618.1:169-4362(-)
MKRVLVAGVEKHGHGAVQFAWHPDNNSLATCGANRILHLYDRKGEVLTDCPLDGAGACIGLDWDKDGDLLAVTQSNLDYVSLFDPRTRSLQKIECGATVTWCKWAKAQPVLAIGTSKGNLVFYNKKTQKKLPTAIGKHTRKVLSGAWNLEGKLVTGSEDRTLTISNAESDTLQAPTQVKAEPWDIQFSKQKTDRDASRDKKSLQSETTISANLGSKTILLYNLLEPQNPVELAFQQRYGNIESYRWYGDGYLVVGFSNGFVVMISTHMKEIGEELFSNKFHNGLESVCCHDGSQRVAAAADGCVKLIDATDWKELKTDRVQLDGQAGSVKNMEFSADGQFLTVSTHNGYVYSFLSRLPLLTSASGTKVAYLTSLREVTIIDTASRTGTTSTAVEVEVEPSFVSVGPSHIATGMNTQMWFYRWNEGTSLVQRRDYVSVVNDVVLNSTQAAILSEGKVYLHEVEPDQESTEPAKGDRSFPDTDDEGFISCVALTEEMLIMGFNDGRIRYYYPKEGAFVSEFRHPEPIKKVFPNDSGTRCVFVDATGSGYVYNPVNDHALAIPDFSAMTERVLWDTEDKNIFVTIDSQLFQTYCYAPVTVYGPKVDFVGPLDIFADGSYQIQGQPTKVPQGFLAASLTNGTITGQVMSGALSILQLGTHDAVHLHTSTKESTDTLRHCFQQNLALLRFSSAWNVTVVLNGKDLLMALARRALEILDLEFSMKVYRKLGDIAMVMALEQMIQIDDKNLLLGYVAAMLQDFDAAQEFFLLSSKPIAALELRRDLRQWETAMKLSKTLAPEQLPIICREYATQLESSGDAEQSLLFYEKGLMKEEAKADRRRRKEPVSEAVAIHNRLCYGGIARMAIRVGDISRGFNIAVELNDPQLSRDCAALFESLKQWTEAAQLYEKVDMFEKAAAIYIQTKNFKLAGQIMQKISTPKLHLQYAKAKETEGQFAEAAAAYERAKDWSSVIRLNIEHLHNPEKAAALARQYPSGEAAEMVAQFCQTRRDFKGAIEFVLMAKRFNEAFDLAQAHDEMEYLSELIGSTASPEDLTRMAQYFESQKKYPKAGDCYQAAGNFQKALKLYLLCGETQLDKAIELVGKARNDALSYMLVDYLMGESDGQPKDPHYVFKLYLALGNFKQAANTAIIIARQEQELGNYKYAHDILFDTHKDLEAQKIHVPQDMTQSLMLIHSYVLVKRLVKMGDHKSGARMLIRVARNISRFPAHTVPILTSTVIECHRAGLKQAAYEYAVMLMRPEHRAELSEQYKRKIENVARKPVRETDEEEALSACPFCSSAIPETMLDCQNCKNTIPYCIATGRHMVLNDWSRCPLCRFPALHSEFVKTVEVDSMCPMCEKQIMATALERLSPSEAMGILKAQAAQSQTDEPEGKSSNSGAPLM